jgi:hypothetical protein
MASILWQACTELGTGFKNHKALFHAHKNNKLGVVCTPFTG